MPELYRFKKVRISNRVYLGLLLLIILFNLFVLSNSSERQIISGESPQIPQISERLNWKPELIIKALQRKPYLAYTISLLTLGGMLALLVGVAIDIRYILLKFKNKEIVKSCLELEPARWKIWDVCKVAILFLFFSQIIYGFEYLFFHLDIYLRMVINTYILDVTVITLVIFVVTAIYRQSLSSLGLSLKNWLKAVFVGIVGYITILPTLFLITLVVFSLARGLDYQPPHQAVFDLFLIEQRKAVIVLSTILVAILGPIGEEIFFRGFMYKAIRNRFGVRIGLILSAALFAGLHNNLIGFLPIMALGMLLAYLYEKSGSLIPSITVHIIHNSLIVLFVFLVREIVKLL
jgi:hypothetical protein